MAQLSKEQEKQMDIMTSTTSTREEKLAATKLYTDMIKMESVAVDPENFMGEMDVPEKTTENEEDNKVIYINKYANWMRFKMSTQTQAIIKG